MIKERLTREWKGPLYANVYNKFWDDRIELVERIVAIDIRDIREQDNFNDIVYLILDGLADREATRYLLAEATPDQTIN